MIPHIILLFVAVSSSFAQQYNPGCLLQPVEGNPRMFQVNAPFRGNRRFPCPTNTLFDPKHCGCGWVDKPINPSPGSLRPGTGVFGPGSMGRPGGGGMMGGVGMDPGMGMGGTGMDPGSVVDPSILTEPITTTRPPCTLKANRDRHMYDEFIQGREWQTRPCPMGTLFNQASCACHDIDPNQKYTCNPELWINFNGREIEDSAGYQISVGNNGNVVNVSNAGRFDGTGTLTVWQYANQDLGTGLTVNLKFYEFPGGASDEQVLIANCYARQLGSIEIALDTKNKMVIFRVEARIGRYPEGVELLIPYREKAWKNVTLAYDGNEVVAKVDDEIKTAPLKGHITTRYNGFLIGSCNGRGYVGYIDDLRLYRCLLDQRLDNGFPRNLNMNNMNNMGNMNAMGSMNTMTNNMNAMGNNMNAMGANMNTMGNNMNTMTDTLNAMGNNMNAMGANINNNMNNMNNMNTMDATNTMNMNNNMDPGAAMDPSMGGQPMI